MPVNIHGNSYTTVAERIKLAGDNLKSVNSEVLAHNPVVIKVTVVTDKGTFTGISAANPTKQIEKQSPYEVAETSALGRALGFSRYGLTDSIASADEMQKANIASPTPVKQTVTTQPQTSTTSATTYTKSQEVTFSLQDKDHGLATAICDVCGSHMYFNEGTSKAGKPYTNLKCEGDKNHVVWYPKPEKASNWAKLNEMPDKVVDIDFGAIEEMPL